MEGVFEDDSQLRRCVENELLSEPNISPEQALKVYTYSKMFEFLEWSHFSKFPTLHVGHGTYALC